MIKIITIISSQHQSSKAIVSFCLMGEPILPCSVSISLTTRHWSFLKKWLVPLDMRLSEERGKMQFHHVLLIMDWTRYLEFDYQMCSNNHISEVCKYLILFLFMFIFFILVISLISLRIFPPLYINMLSNSQSYVLLCI